MSRRSHKNSAKTIATLLIVVSGFLTVVGASAQPVSGSVIKLDPYMVTRKLPGFSFADSARLARVKQALLKIPSTMILRVGSSRIYYRPTDARLASSSFAATRAPVRPRNGVQVGWSFARGSEWRRIDTPVNLPKDTFVVVWGRARNGTIALVTLDGGRYFANAKQLRLLPPPAQDYDFHKVVCYRSFGRCNTKLYGTSLTPGDVDLLTRSKELPSKLAQGIDYFAKAVKQCIRKALRFRQQQISRSRYSVVRVRSPQATVNRSCFYTLVKYHKELNDAVSARNSLRHALFWKVIRKLRNWPVTESVVKRLPGFTVADSYSLAKIQQAFAKTPRQQIYRLGAVRANYSAGSSRRGGFSSVPDSSSKRHRVGKWLTLSWNANYGINWRLAKKNLLPRLSPKTPILLWGPYGKYGVLLVTMDGGRYIATKAKIRRLKPKWDTLPPPLQHNHLTPSDILNRPKGSRIPPKTLKRLSQIQDTFKRCSGRIQASYERRANRVQRARLRYHTKEARIARIWASFGRVVDRRCGRHIRRYGSVLRRATRFWNKKRSALYKVVLNRLVPRGR